MPRRPPWTADDDAFLHDNDECIYGGEIPPADRRIGPSDKPLCDLCARLDRAEEELLKRASGNPR
jgi:hypothetical protein